jgi:protein-L-isoaspartate(D-aspartate) O-methyltransferase
MTNEDQERLRMVAEQIEARGINNKAVLQSIKKVPRHLFVPASYRQSAYRDQPLPSSCGQTISQPYIVALMTELLSPTKGQKVLEIGTGTGYQTAILAELVKEVYTMEIYADLQKTAKANLEPFNYRNIHFILGNGYQGYPEAAPYDLIMVTAAPPFIPEVLIDQLSIGGRLVIPVGRERQELYLITKETDESIRKNAILPVIFVTMQQEKRE